MKTVLILDGSACVQFYHKLLLARAGYDTVTATDASEALATLRNRVVDLIMLELALPKMGGTEFLNECRHARDNAVPVLVVSTEAERVDARALPSAAQSEALQKPVLPDALLAAVQRLIG
jgi:DNA-binding response OmpR family regulator